MNCSNETANHNFEQLMNRLDDLESQARAYARDRLRATNGEDFQIELDSLKRRVASTERSTLGNSYAWDNSKEWASLERRVDRLEEDNSRSLQSAPGVKTEKLPPTR
jgi:hypothetical protein